MDLSKFDFLLKQDPPKEQEQEKIPAGTYKTVISDIDVKETKAGNPIIITKFKILPEQTIKEQYYNKQFKYFRAIPTETNSKAGYIKQKLLQEYITGLGIKSLSELDSVVGKRYLVDLSYNKDFVNIRILGGMYGS